MAYASDHCYRLARSISHLQAESTPGPFFCPLNRFSPMRIEVPHNANLMTNPTAGRKTLLRLDEVIGREMPRIGTAPTSGSPARLNRQTAARRRQPCGNTCISASSKCKRPAPKGKFWSSNWLPLKDLVVASLIAECILVEGSGI
jgi:hypothetical protein